MYKQDIEFSQIFQEYYITNFYFGYIYDSQIISDNEYISNI